MDGLSIRDATQRQRDAADPAQPRIVNANAGSGKTKVLVDRVSRILLQGTDPDKILCITYTRAAASEMQERLYETLSKWSIARDDALKSVLSELYGQPFEAISPALDLNRVRTHFASALETPEGLKVMTIHAFCERIVARFPIEAGILPGFDALDDAEACALLDEGRTLMLGRARQDSALRDALHHMAAAKADSTIDAELFASAREFERTQAWMAAGGLEPFRRAARIGPDDTPDTIARDAWADTDMRLLEEVALFCSGLSAKTAQAFVGKAGELAREADPTVAFAGYSSIFLTQAGSPRKSVLVKAVGEAFPLYRADSPEVDRILDARARMASARIAKMSEALLTLGHALGTHHQRAKHRARGLDFNDLILKARDLLTRTEVSEWVAYKLDGGVEHVLLDEAQDTAPAQWDIIDALTAPFAQDAPDRDGPRRTFFAVGDPKQSIYRFQGARPEIFMNSVRTRTAPGDVPVQLRMSFRSAQEVLDVVDALFIDQGGMAAMFDAQAHPEASELARHVAARDDAGLVELWPLAPKADKLEDRAPWDTTPVDAGSDADPRIVLARTIAGTIAHWIERGEPVFDRKLRRLRPMQAGDVLILVQKRIGGLFDAIIKALKDEGLPVAGADRLVLQDALIVRDLLALTRFVLLPHDELSLAEALKSPLFGLDDDQLFDLCVDRGGTLWESVQARDPVLAAHLDAIRADADLAPFDFYARLLERTGPHGMSYREALLQRLGLESREALDAFLTLALEHQQRQAPSLQRFLQAFTADTVEIKRDKDAAGADIRVMTVHGAKGLEAPVVFLPDTTRKPKATSGGLIRAGDTWIVAPSAANSTPLVDRYKEAHDAEEMREYMRLLYVAMTRAESRLVLCGYHDARFKEGFADGAWYPWLRKTVMGMDGAREFSTDLDGEGATGWRYGTRHDPVKGEETERREPAPLPDWIRADAPSEPLTTREAVPSQLLSPEAELSSPPGRGNVLRGIVLHKMLELLPDQPAERRRAVAGEIVAGYPVIDEAQGRALVDEVFSVLDHPDFAAVFADGSRAEVSLAGTIHDTFVNAQVDRLSVVGNTVYLVDYKSNRDAPDEAGSVPDAYLAQMAAYRELARAIWPDHDIRCGLLWTVRPRMMWLDDAAMDRALTQVEAVLTSRTQT